MHDRRAGIAQAEVGQERDEGAGHARDATAQPDNGGEPFGDGNPEAAPGGGLGAASGMLPR
jgi:hypothetical protein